MHPYLIQLTVNNVERFFHSSAWPFPVFYSGFVLWLRFLQPVQVLCWFYEFGGVLSS